MQGIFFNKIHGDVGFLLPQLSVTGIKVNVTVSK